jgi:hypothetical protein
MNNMPTGNDALMQELRSEVERERWLEIWQQYRVLIISVVALIILATGAHSYWKHTTAQKSMALTEGLYDAGSAESRAKPAEAAQKLSDFAAKNPNTPAAFMAELQAANLKLESDDVAGAVSHIEAALATKDIDDNLRAIATIFYARVGLESVEPTTLLTKLQPYLNMKSPYRFQAYETAALIAYRQGDVESAQDHLTKIVDDVQAPQSERQRALGLQRVLK